MPFKYNSMANVDYLIVAGGGAGGIAGNSGSGGGGGGGAGGLKGTEFVNLLASFSGGNTGNTFSAGSTEQYSQMITTPAGATSVTGVSVYIEAVQYDSTSFSCALYAVNGSGEPTGSALGSGSATVSSATGVFQEVTVTFSSPATVSGSTNYAVVVYSPGSGMEYLEGGNTSGQNTFYSSNGGSTWTAVDGPINLTAFGYLTCPITAGSYSVVVGAGATGLQTLGGTSSFNGVSATGGGGGGGDNTAGTQPSDVAGQSGGSGGGGGSRSGTNGAGGSGTAFQGYAGGNSANNIGAGGGGAGEAGTNGATGQLGNGGNGVSSSINGTATYYAGGGGGGAVVTGSTVASGGLGGGGNGGANYGTGYPVYNGTAGVANTGGGGGGAGGGASEAPGGSGIVIVRYKTGDFGADSSGGTITRYTNAGVSYVVHTFTASGTLVLTAATGSFLMFMP